MSEPIDQAAIAACDLAEVIGSAIALKLLFGLPLPWGILLTTFDVLLVLYLQHKGFRRLEALVIALVAVVGEFGRTPKVSNLPGQPKPGRDHWAACYSGLFAGAGVKGGQVIGKSDSKAAYPVTPSYTPYDIGATIYQVLGIDPHTIVHNHLNQPRELVKGTPVTSLFA